MAPTPIAPPPLVMLEPNRVWRTYTGGRTLDMLEERRNPRDSHFPEDWIASTTAAVNPVDRPETEGLSTLRLAGRTQLLSDFIADFPEAVLGPTHVSTYGLQTEFLLKLLDSSVRLHLQAHPTARFARERLNSRSGKTEAYLILSVRPEVPEAYIYLGFQRSVGREDFRRAVVEQDVTRMLGLFGKIPVIPGDVFVVPGGLPHAIGEGIFMIEIMEPTDFVVRFEFDRGGYILPEEARFMGRDVDFALDMLDLAPYPIERLREMSFCTPRLVASGEGGTEEALVDETRTPSFSLNRLRVSGTFTRRGHGFAVGVVTQGRGHVGAGRAEYPLRRGRGFLIPYQTAETHFRSEGDLEVVLAFPPRCSLPSQGLPSLPGG